MSVMCEFIRGSTNELEIIQRLMGATDRPNCVAYYDDAPSAPLRPPPPARAYPPDLRLPPALHSQRGHRSRRGCRPEPACPDAAFMPAGARKDPWSGSVHALRGQAAGHRKSGPSLSRLGQPIWPITKSISPRTMSIALLTPASPPATAP